MLSERTITRESVESTIPAGAVSYADFPAVEADKLVRELDCRQQADHFTATFGSLAMMQLSREG